MTHRSWCAENPDSVSNERLEFLGDAVLGLAVTEHAYVAHPSLSEGELAKVRAAVVNAATLAELADELELGAALRLGKGEEASGGRQKQSILADALEAVIGALHSDGGWLVAREFVIGMLESRIAEAADVPGSRDHKTLLQELAVHRYGSLPYYEVHDVGPDHEKRFFATVRIEAAEAGRGEGRSKKEAEQAAAAAAWASLAGSGNGDESDAA